MVVISLEIQIYIGRSNSVGRRGHGTKTLRFLRFKTEDANHIGFLGPSGFGKTTIMRGLVEAIWTAFLQKGIRPFIFVFERKIDISKSEKIKEIYIKETNKYSDEMLMKKYGKKTWNYVKQYVNLLNKYPTQLGAIGDFAFGFPNVIARFHKIKSDTSILGDFGLSLKSFPVRRIVFRPRRPLKLIQIDNGWDTEVVEGKIAYKDIPYSILENIGSISGGTVYGRRLYRIWELEKVRDPDKVLELALQYEKKPDDPSMTYLSIQEIMERIKLDPLFTPNNDESFLKFLTNKKINVIDFSQNSDLTTLEEMVIFKMIVEKMINVAMKLRIPVFFVVDEVQNIMTHPIGRWALDKILREGRSLGITLIYATQYLHGVRDKNVLVNGTTHFGIVGKIASREDYKLLSSIIPDIDEDMLLDECSNIDEFENLRNKLRFKGYFSYGKVFTEWIRYRPPQSL
jgi:hypothetical protein